MIPPMPKLIGRVYKDWDGEVLTVIIEVSPRSPMSWNSGWVISEGRGGMRRRQSRDYVRGCKLVSPSLGEALEIGKRVL